MNTYYVAGIPCSDELYHHGILGQKWGVRRYQNRDGSLTSEGREHYGVKSSRSGSIQKVITNTGNAVKRTAKNAGIGVGRFSKRISEGVGRAAKDATSYTKQRIKMSHPSLMTDQELKNYTQRLIAENNYNDLKAKAKSTDSFAGARSVVEKIVSAPVKGTFKVAGNILEKGAYTLADAGFKKIAQEMTKTRLERENDILERKVKNKELREKLTKKEEGGLEKARRIMNNPNASDEDIFEANKILTGYNNAKKALDSISEASPSGDSISKTSPSDNSSYSSTVERVKRIINHDPPANKSGYAPFSTSNNGYKMKPLDDMNGPSKLSGEKTAAKIRRIINYDPPANKSGYAPSVVDSPSKSYKDAMRADNDLLRWIYSNKSSDSFTSTLTHPDKKIENTIEQWLEDNRVSGYW